MKTTENLEQTVDVESEKKIIINENQNAISNAKRRASEGATDLNNLLAELNSLQLNVSFSIDEMLNFILLGEQVTERVIRQKVVDTSTGFMIGNLKMDKEKVASMVELPDLSAVFALVKQLSTRLRSVNGQDDLLAQKYYFIEDGKVKVNSELLEKFFDEKYRFFITESENEALNNAIEVLDGICEKYGRDPKNAIVQFNRNNTGCELNKKFFKVS